MSANPSESDLHCVLVGQSVSVVLDWSRGVPEMVHLGARLESWNRSATDRPVPLGTLAVDPVLGVFVEEGSGVAARPGLLGARLDGGAWSPRFAVEGEPELTATSARFVLTDPIAELTIDLSVEIDAADAIVMSTGLVNTGSTSYSVHRFAPSIAVPAHFTETLTFTGRWCAEFQPQRSELVGCQVVDNRRGRTSHDRLPAMFIGTPGFTEQTGEVLGAQLAWSGNYELAAERLADGRTHLQAGELLFPGEVQLAPGERLEAPKVVAAWSAKGLNAVSTAFHRHLRLHSPVAGRPRKVGLNTWEAVYFDHDLDTLTKLAEAAAEVGVERFVLDDGWFGSRRDDTAGLGDWWVSDEVWPDGLGPLAERVNALGMEFGLWFEPEMVNPDSDLYRDHPEWALIDNRYDPIIGRNQLVLDLARPEVRDLLFSQISAVLTDVPIGYVKWDMNRDLVQPTLADGRAGYRANTLGFYELLDRLRAAHPDVEWESCSSGGGRADLGVLGRAERIWTSDNNDAVQRQAIQRGCSMLFPPEVMGAHIGPDRAHLTQRTQDLGFRGATAFFGHLGIEWNLLEAGELGRLQLSQIIAEHKRLRPLLHSGTVVRCDHVDTDALVHGVVDTDGRHGLFAYVQVNPSSTMVPVPARLAGLDPRVTYEVRRIAVDFGIEFGHKQPGWWTEGARVSGAQLMSVGLQPPVMFPQSAVLVELVAVSD